MKATHARLGELEVLSVDPQGKWLECVSPDGRHVKYCSYIFEADQRTTYQIVSDVLTAKGINFTVSKSAKSESTYYKFGANQIRVSAHENGCSFPYIHIESGSKESKVLEILAANNI